MGAKKKRKRLQIFFCSFFFFFLRPPTEMKSFPLVATEKKNRPKEVSTPFEALYKTYL